MPKRADITNRKYGKLTALVPHHRGKFNNWFWMCSCECGGQSVQSVGRLRKGEATHCGCEHNLVKRIEGEQFNNLLVLRQIGFDKRKNALWECACQCGLGAEPVLVNGITRHIKGGIIAGCHLCRTERTIASKKSHGYARKHQIQPVKYRLWRSAKERARKLNMPFSITPDDVVDPGFCPLLGTKIEPKRGNSGPNSPSLDKIVPSLGYVPGNVWVISKRANWIKSDATPEELELLAKNLRKKFQAMAAEQREEAA